MSAWPRAAVPTSATCRTRAGHPYCLRRALSIASFAPPPPPQQPPQLSDAGDAFEKRRLAAHAPRRRLSKHTAKLRGLLRRSRRLRRGSRRRDVVAISIALLFPLPLDTYPIAAHKLLLRCSHLHRPFELGASSGRQKSLPLRRPVVQPRCRRRRNAMEICKTCQAKTRPSPRPPPPFASSQTISRSLAHFLRPAPARLTRPSQRRAFISARPQSTCCSSGAPVNCLLAF